MNPDPYITHPDPLEQEELDALEWMERQDREAQEHAEADELEGLSER